MMLIEFNIIILNSKKRLAKAEQQRRKRETITQSSWRGKKNLTNKRRINTWSSWDNCWKEKSQETRGR